MKKVLVTGAAGFIGYHVCKRLCHEGYQVVGVDSINDYYDVSLKYSRLQQLGVEEGKAASHMLTVSEKNIPFSFMRMNIEDFDSLNDLFRKENFEVVINLAAQAGVRYSIQHPRVYINANVNGFFNILELCRQMEVKHLIYASTSSVYGLNEQMPLSEKMPADHPISLYAATKKANEMMAHSYSHLFGLPTTGLRFFTVYGPWGRPDMALFLFAEAISNGKPLQLYNGGNMVRDFTYVSDVAESISRLISKPPQKGNSDYNPLLPDASISSAPYRILNIGNSNPVPLLKYVEALEKELGKPALKEYLPMQQGDVPYTHADCSALEQLTGYRPRVKVEEGIAEFVKWYTSFYRNAKHTDH